MAHGDACRESFRKSLAGHGCLAYHVGLAVGRVPATSLRPAAARKPGQLPDPDLRFYVSSLRYNCRRSIGFDSKAVSDKLTANSEAVWTAEEAVAFLTVARSGDNRRACNMGI